MRRVSSAAALLPMAVFLTQNSPGLRTSPVKRGYWVVRRVLGEVIPPPPPVVPELPHDEAKIGSADCATCWRSIARIRFAPAATRGSTSFGWRSKATDRWARRAPKIWPDGRRYLSDISRAASQGSGFEGVQAYIREHRQKDFVDNLSRKLLAYALDRSLLLSDEPLVEKMEARLAANGYRFDSLVETIVTSPQFLNKRNAERAAPGEPAETSDD